MSKKEGNNKAVIKPKLLCAQLRTICLVGGNSNQQDNSSITDSESWAGLCN